MGDARAGRLFRKCVRRVSELCEGYLRGSHSEISGSEVVRAVQYHRQEQLFPWSARRGPHRRWNRQYSVWSTPTRLPSALTDVSVCRYAFLLLTTVLLIALPILARVDVAKGAEDAEKYAAREGGAGRRRV